MNAGPLPVIEVWGAAHLTRRLTVWEGHGLHVCVSWKVHRHARRAWSTVFESGPKCFSLMLYLGADAGVMFECPTWEILAPLTSLGSCRERLGARLMHDTPVLQYALTVYNSWTL